MIFFRSIKGKLLVWIFVSIASLIITFSLCLFGKFKEIIFDSVDHLLHSKLQLVKGLMHAKRDKIEFEVNEIVMGEYIIPRSGHYYQIMVDKKIEVSSASLVDKAFNLASGRLESYDANVREWIYISTGPGEEPIRVIRHDFHFMKKAVSILVAESISGHLKMIDRINNYFFLILPLMIILVGVVGLIIVSHSLKPLEIFSSSIEKVTHESLDKRIDGCCQALELKVLAESFNSLLARLQAAFLSEKQLIANAAHDLKSPLAIVAAQCDISLQKERTKAEYISSLNEIKSVSGNMQDKISNMLTLARLDSGMLLSSTFKKVSLPQCLDDAIRLIEPQARAKNIIISKRSKGDFFVVGDRDTLTEAFFNIIENAVKYNAFNGMVDIEIKNNRDQKIISVSDSGSGIHKEEIEKIFDRFYRSDKSRGTDGTGLGLSIAKAIIQAHHGDIHVRNKVPKGTCFIITLP